MQTLQVIDSHTAGEPTRVVVSGGPELGGGPLADRVALFRSKFDSFRSAVVNEPRGSDVLVGALLVPPADSTCIAGVIFFNNVDYLFMCGHGMIGVVRTLAHLGRISPGVHRIDTSVGVVTAKLAADGAVSIENVPSWRSAWNVAVEVPGMGRVTGDIAWGGNWFFLAHHLDLDLSVANAERLRDLAVRVRKAVNEQGHPEVDHVEFVGPAGSPKANARNFVLCPGSAYDRSPCGTGTSAKVACLAADGKLAPGQVWVQEGILGTSFSASYQWHDRPTGKIVPTITGTAYITGEAKLILDETDPFCWGIRG